MKFSKFYELVEEKIGSVFEKWGRIVAAHAWKIIIITIIVNGALGIGMLRLSSELNSSILYHPLDTRSQEYKVRVESMFPDLTGSVFSRLSLTDLGAWAKVIVRAKSGNLLNTTTLMRIKAFNDLIVNITAVKKDGTVIKYDDICAKFGHRCSVEGELFWTPEFIAAIESGQVPYPKFSTALGTTDYATDLGGKITTTPDGAFLTGMEYINIDYNIRTDGEQYKEMARLWTDAFKEAIETFSSEDFAIAYGHFNSLDEELDKNIAGDITFFAATLAIMITYACLATLSARITDQVGQRMWLGLAGILAAGLAILSAFGLVAACGVKFVSILGVMPFLVIGIGIDDMFILLSGLSGSVDKVSVEDRIAGALKSSGVGITITSLTDLLAFLVGSASKFVAVKNFCTYTGVSVVFCYLNNITFFAACMAINERRVQYNRHFGSCHRIKTKKELEEEGRSRNYVICCGGRPPKTRAEAESFADKLPRWLIPKIVLRTPFKICIVLLFLGYLGGAIYGCMNLKQGLQFTQLMEEESYFYKFASWEEKHFARYSPVSFVIDRTYNYSDPVTQSLIQDLMTSTMSNEYFHNTFAVSWLQFYINSSYYDGASDASFITGLQQFLQDPRFTIFVNDVIINLQTMQITASRVYVMSTGLGDTQKEGAMMLKARDIADNAKIHCFAFSPYFVAFEQYVAILPQTLQSVGIALAAVVIITCIFMPHPLLIIYVTLAVIMIMVGVFGYIYYLDVALSAITMIQLIMSIGFSVDFTAHICHGYMTSRGRTRSIRVKGAIDKTGAPVFHGAMSSLLGIVLLVGAKSYIFRTFAKVMALVLLFGIAHALLLLPIILSWIGPSCSEMNQSKRDGNYQIKSIDNRGFNTNDEESIAGRQKRHHSNAVRSGLNLDEQWGWTEIKK